MIQSHTHTQNTEYIYIQTHTHTKEILSIVSCAIW